MQAIPSFDSAPPLTLPVRYFLAAAGWLLPLCAALSRTGGDYPSLDLLLPLHLLVLGVLGNVMLGALLQMLAVVSGVSYRQPGWWQNGVWCVWQLATASLCWGFYRALAVFNLQLASGLFALVALALLMLLHTLWRSPAQDGSSRGLRVALLLLLLTVMLGVAMLAVLGWGRAWPLWQLLPLHRLAAQGWLCLLVMAVVQTIAPMFLMTPAYPAWWQRYGAFIWLACLLLAGIGILSLPHAGSSLLAWLPLPVFAALTLRLLWQCRRPQEWLLPFWWLAFSCLLLVLVLYPLALWQGFAPFYARALGWWLAGGFVMSLAVGMLYRIVPFLLWLHLKKLAPPRHKMPTMHVFMPEPAARQAWRGLLGLQLVAALWVWRPGLGSLLALSLFCFGLLLLRHFWAAARQYRACCRTLPPV